MQRNLPSMAALKAFEASARCLSFSRAAEELFLTQGAVSKQVQQLEHYLDQSLFERLPTGIQLTAAGELYYPPVCQALDILQASTAQLSQAGNISKVVSLDISPSLSSLWLIPRLADFNARHGDIHLDIQVGDGNIRAQTLNADIAIRCLPLGNYAEARLIAEERLLLIANAQQQRQAPLDTMDSLSAQTLIPHLTRPQLWSAFLAAQFDESASHSPAGFQFGAGFQHFYMTLEAVLHGMGFGLVPDFMAAAALYRGDVVNPLESSFRSGYGYYLTVPAHKAQLGKNRRVVEWLIEQFSDNDGWR
ncbi:LysR substrate-binding domain-containing protein [Motiliproteus sp.]|uniref:LysR substrate-binding domain-containing protein n=1 Tax=Motiliproteus sp. TaxID=1898955 RepID=UPI003BA9F345